MLLEVDRPNLGEVISHRSHLLAGLATMFYVPENGRRNYIPAGIHKIIRLFARPQ